MDTDKLPKDPSLAALIKEGEQYKRSDLRLY